MSENEAPEKVASDEPTRFGEVEIRKATIGQLVAKGVSLVDKAGNVLVTLSAGTEGGGIWVHGPNQQGPMLAIYSVNGQAAIGIYESSKPKGPLPLALFLDQDGRPTVQLRGPGDDPNDVRFIDLLKLVDMIEAATKKPDGPALSTARPVPVAERSPTPPVHRGGCNIGPGTKMPD